MHSTRISAYPIMPSPHRATLVDAMLSWSSEPKVRAAEAEQVPSLADLAKRCALATSKEPSELIMDLLDPARGQSDFWRIVSDYAGTIITRSHAAHRRHAGLVHVEEGREETIEPPRYTRRTSRYLHPADFTKSDLFGIAARLAQIGTELGAYESASVFARLGSKTPGPDGLPLFSRDRGNLIDAAGDLDTLISRARDTLIGFDQEVAVDQALMSLSDPSYTPDRLKPHNRVVAVLHKDHPANVPAGIERITHPFPDFSSVILARNPATMPGLCISYDQTKATPIIEVRPANGLIEIAASISFDLTIVNPGAFLMIEAS